MTALRPARAPRHVDYSSAAARHVQNSYPSAFATATDLYPQLVDARVMQARIAGATQGPEAARQILDQALAANPGDVALSVMRIEMGIPPEGLSAPASPSR